MARFWTVESAQAAVKAAFFTRGILLPGESPEVWLRFSELRRAVSDTQGPIGDRTLSRALKSLLTSGQMKKRTTGRASQYTIVVSRQDRVKAFARAEAAVIQSAGEVGGRGDSSEGWALFGISDVVPRRFVRRMRAECLAHQDQLREILDDVWEEALGSVLHPARKRVSREVFRKGKRSVPKLLEYQLIGAHGLAYSTRFWGIVEQTIPGSLRSYQRGMFQKSIVDVPISESIAVVAAKLSGKSIEDLRPEIEKEFDRLQRQVQRLATAFTPLWDALTPSERERATRRIQAATLMVASLTSVVHA